MMPASTPPAVTPAADDQRRGEQPSARPAHRAGREPSASAPVAPGTAQDHGQQDGQHHESQLRGDVREGHDGDPDHQRPQADLADPLQAAPGPPGRRRARRLASRVRRPASGVPASGVRRASVQGPMTGCPTTAGMPLRTASSEPPVSAMTAAGDARRLDRTVCDLTAPGRGAPAG